MAGAGKSGRGGRALWALLGALALLAAVRAGMSGGWFASPFPAPGRALAWGLGVPASAYNFDVVVPGRVYRSAEPDARFLAWLKRRYGIERVIGLAGDVPAHRAAAALGLAVTTFRWPSRRLPPWDELVAVASLLESGGPVLVHCASGSDRTGWALALYRVLHQHWRLERAVREMARYGHEPDLHAVDHRAFAARLGAS